MEELTDEELAEMILRAAMPGLQDSLDAIKEELHE